MAQSTTSEGLRHKYSSIGFNVINSLRSGDNTQNPVFQDGVEVDFLLRIEESHLCARANRRFLYEHNAITYGQGYKRRRRRVVVFTKHVLRTYSTANFVQTKISAVVTVRFRLGPYRDTVTKRTTTSPTSSPRSTRYTLLTLRGAAQVYERARRQFTPVSCLKRRNKRVRICALHSPRTLRKHSGRETRGVVAAGNEITERASELS